LLDESGNFKGTAARVPRRPFSELVAAATYDPTSDRKPEEFGPVLEIAVDHLPTPSSIFTSTKTEHRPQYDAARARAGVPPLGVTPSAPAPSDVLLFNEDNKLTETSIRNIAFFRDGAWITPNADTGCLTGVVRRHLLSQGLIREAGEGHALMLDDVRDQEIVMLLNGVEGCKLGRIVKST
jgi:4-amino-4-deoxychorismate lyase